MKSLVVYESFFGNTEKIAQAIGNSLDPENVKVLKVTDADAEQLNGIELLVVGSPTRAFRPTKGIVAFLDGIAADGLKGVKVAAFDTRVKVDGNKKVPGILRVAAKLFGYAASPIADKLKKKGGTLVSGPEGFFVKDSEGPLEDGEIERAAQWAKSL